MEEIKKEVNEELREEVKEEAAEIKEAAQEAETAAGEEMKAAEEGKKDTAEAAEEVKETSGEEKAAAAEVKNDAEEVQETAAAVEEDPKKKKKVRKHVILDRPIIGFFVQLVISLLFIGNLESLFALVFDLVTPDFGAAISIFLASLVFFGLYKRWFRPDFKGTLTFKRFGKGFLITLVPIAAVCILNTIQSAQSGLTSQIGKALGMALVAGIGEEAMFRTTVISNFMRTQRREEKIPVILWLSALTFGLMHAANLTGGADITMTVVQVLSATCAGVFFGAIYVKTACIWPCIIAHTLVDFTCFIDDALLNSSGIMTNFSMTVYEYIALGIDVVMLIIGVIITSKKYRREILVVWDERWSRSAE